MPQSGSHNHPQIPLNLQLPASFAEEDYIVSPCNQAAHALVLGWPSWPNHVVALVGEQGCGKSHLAHIWSVRVGAYVWNKADNIVDVIENNPNTILVDDADSGIISDDDLFHLYNWQKETGGYLLLTGKSAPNLWPVSLPDLKSRLATFHVAEVAQPDDMLLSAILHKLFSDKQLEIKFEVIDYILPRMERSFLWAYQLVEKVDQSALAQKRKITKPMVRECIEELSSSS